MSEKESGVASPVITLMIIKMIYYGGAQIFRLCQPTAVGEGQWGTCVGFHSLAEGAASARGGDLVWLIAGEVI